jgi:hypothetical protein
MYLKGTPLGLLFYACMFVRPKESRELAWPTEDVMR